MLKAPFPWFGGKSRAAKLIWERFGDVGHYVEPFAGSLAVLLGRPTDPHVETVNDLDCFVANFWRATSKDPEQVARYADNPVNEADLTARHIWIVNQQEFRDRMFGDPDYYDAKIAGWWVWGQSCWIGSGWCSGKGPWVSVDGSIVDSRKLPHLGDAGKGVNRQLPHLGGAGQGVNRSMPILCAGRGVLRNKTDLTCYFNLLRDRLCRVRVACGDWHRVVSTGALSVNNRAGAVGILLDPPYSDKANRAKACYAVDSLDVAHDVRSWALEHGDDPTLRIALCCYEGEHEMPGNWSKVEWKAMNGYKSHNGHKERIWFSPHCLQTATTQDRQLTIEDCNVQAI